MVCHVPEGELRVKQSDGMEFSRRRVMFGRAKKALAKTWRMSARPWRSYVSLTCYQDEPRRSTFPFDLRRCDRKRRWHARDVSRVRVRPRGSADIKSRRRHDCERVSLDLSVRRQHGRSRRRGRPGLQLPSKLMAQDMFGRSPARYAQFRAPAFPRRVPCRSRCPALVKFGARSDI